MLRTAQGYEKLSFKDALYQEKLSYTGSLEEEFSNLDIGKFIAKDSKVRTYLLEGCYLPQIKKWYSVFGKDDILIIQSENWFKNSDLVFKQILEFLGLPFYKLDELKKTGSAATIPMDQATREELVDFYRPYNARLFDFLGHSFEWD
jgi:hypothetical protein